MDILLLCASARKKGNCDSLLRVVQREIEREGFATDLLYLSDLAIHTCQGCLACVYRGRCKEEDDQQLLVEKLVEAKGLVLAAPTYIFSASSIVKTIVDRSLMMSPYLEELKNRKRWAVSISVAGNCKWNYLGVESVNLMALAYQFRVLDYLEAFAPGPGEVLLQDDLLAMARERGKSLAFALKGEIHRRPPSSFQCPSCYSRSFRLIDGRSAQCPFCGLKGEREEKGLTFAGGYEGMFFAPENLKEHLISWVMATRDRFKENIPALRERRALFIKE